jgi:hypothetical protein
MLVGKDIVPTLQLLVDGGEEDVWLACAQILQRLSYHSDGREADQLLVINGVFPVLQTMLLHVRRQDTICYLLLTFNNLAPVFDGDAANFIVRSVIGMSGRLEVLGNLANAVFFTDILRSFSRLPRYMNILCEESALPVLLNTVNEFLHPKIIVNMTESFVNLSMSKKNRREISGCGVAQYLDRVFVMGSPEAKAHMLRMIGNLLSSNLFHDRIAREDTLTSMLTNLLDPKQPAQFSGVAYCLSQLAMVSSSVTALVNCDVVRAVLGHLKEIPTDALGYIFTLLVTVASKREFSQKLVMEAHLLVPFMYVQAVAGAEDEGGVVADFVGSGGSTWSQQGQLETLAALAYNLSCLPDFTATVAASPALCALYVKMLKELVKVDNSEVGKVRLLALNGIINLAARDCATRAVILGGEIKYTKSEKEKEMLATDPGNAGRDGTLAVSTKHGPTASGKDGPGMAPSAARASSRSGKGGRPPPGEDIVEIFKAIGYDDADLNLRFAAVVTILSNEEPLCSRLLERGAHVLLVSVLTALAGYDPGTTTRRPRPLPDRSCLSHLCMLARPFSRLPRGLERPPIPGQRRQRAPDRSRGEPGPVAPGRASRRAFPEPH